VRVAKQAEWNKPTWWPIVLLAALVLLLVWIARRGYQARQRETAVPVRPVPVTAVAVRAGP
jgi:hypothetical protein